jgi:hypothetical protein
MKWTKFKEEEPIEAYVFVTNWSSVWPIYQQFGDWTQYAKNNPEYAWAEIPLPELPKEADHHCSDGSISCLGKDGMLRLIWKGVTWKECNYCPFCGYSIREKE